MEKDGVHRGAVVAYRRRRELIFSGETHVTGACRQRRWYSREWNLIRKYQRNFSGGQTPN
jgi:hypothetical protein